ncbi:hypothetical protein [Ureibacillus manganicus]|nr:hypothetical protein [Ureibacillus manganicus]
MMIGSIISNFWVALGTFTIYFLIMFQKPETPFNILLGSFISAIFGFVITFLLRYLIGYILYTPEEIALEADSEENDKPHPHDELQPTVQQKSSSTKAIEDPEEIAKVVKTMMNS